MAVKKGLGKGIRALVDEFELEKSDRAMETEIDIASVIPNRAQPRKHFDQGALEELAQSIKEKGVIQPIVVSDLGNGQYELVVGERRLRASKLAGRKTIPAVIRDLSDADKLELALIENIQREDLNPIEVAEAYREIMTRLNLSQDEVSKVVGKSRPAVANSLRLLKLPEFVKNRIVSGELSEGHARAILSVEDVDRMIDFARFIIENGLSVREAENEAKNFTGGKKSSAQEKLPKRSKPELQDVADRFMQTLGAKVEVVGSLKQGRIQIYYYSREELENLFRSVSKR